MNYIIFSIFFTILFLFLKFINYLLEKKQQSVMAKIEENKNPSNFISINKLKTISNDKFIELITAYLENQGYKDVKIQSSDDTNYKNLSCTLNNEKIYITTLFNNPSDSTDTLDKSNIKTIESFIGKMCRFNCFKGILFNNLTFSNDCLTLTDNINHNSDYKIKLVDGYELSKFIRTDSIKWKEN